MILTRNYARRLISKGVAIPRTLVNKGQFAGHYIAIDRIDLFRIDHYLATAQDIAECEEWEKQYE